MQSPTLVQQPTAARRVGIGAWTLIVGLTWLALVGALGNAWDLYWHIHVGRDTFWIPPHTLMYTAIALGGLTALTVVLGTTFTQPPSNDQTRLWGFRAPLGFFVLGFGALQMVVAAPFDDWWHRAFGVDVSVWSPPHLIGFSGALVMLAGVTIAALAQHQRTPLRSPRAEWAFWALVTLLLALAVRWITFLNSTTLQLSWVLKRDRYAIAGPWAAWWGLWASFGMAWTFAAAARLLPGRRVWTLPLAVCGWAIALRAAEYGVGKLGFALVLPWGSQTLRQPLRPFTEWDLGLWVTTLVLLLPALAQSRLALRGRHWPTLRFGLTSGVLWGGLLAAQFLVLRPVFHLSPLTPLVQVQVLVVALVAGLLGGVVGAQQGDWLAHFRR